MTLLPRTRRQLIASAIIVVVVLACGTYAVLNRAYFVLAVDVLVLLMQLCLVIPATLKNDAAQQKLAALREARKRYGSDG